ncbi:Glutamate-rich protein 2 [Microtus ochrogaster]|uniref:Glutamate-rich protein 2 n=1 Tax=Microtus ochrogaster TaxID=79684 RepID=A0A8J6KK08_MICOH|nr:Glutamate-rich protein 2 [Microtus ochrogaster]
MELMDRGESGSAGPHFSLPQKWEEKERLPDCASQNYLDKKDVVKASKSRPNGTLLVFDPKAFSKMNAKLRFFLSASLLRCLGRRPRLASKLYTSPTQISLGIANTFSAKKEPCAKKTEEKVSSKSPERSVENKDVLTNRQSDLWLSSFLKESADEVDKDTILAKQEKISEYCLEDIEEKLSDSTDGDGDDDTNDEDDEGTPKKETQEAQKQKDEEEDSEEDTSTESEAESSEEGSEDSSDECEDGS